MVALLPLALVLGLIGRGHTLQAMGLEIACQHPDASGAVDDEQGGAHRGDGDHGSCPPSCHDCPCGQMPATEPPACPVPIALQEPIEIEQAPARELVAHVPLDRLDRPPRPIAG